MTTQWKADAEGERGPGWWDVYQMARALETHWQSRAMFEVTTTVTPANKWGIHITVRLQHYPLRFGCGCYGSAFPGNGQKTMAAAMYHALVKLEYDMSRLDMTPPTRCASPLDE